jgi:hypothetical protein
MATKRKFKNDAFEAIHSSASAMYRVGVLRLLLRSNPYRSKSFGSVFVSASRSSPVT